MSRRRPLPLASTHPDWLRFLDEKRREFVAMALDGINYNPEEEPMSWREKAEQLVREGKARTFSEACSMLAKRRRPKQEPQMAMAVPAGYRSPYKDE